MRTLLESIILARNEDVPRYLKIYSELIEQGTLQNLKKFKYLIITLYE